MFFTQEDYKKIQQWLTKNSVKDTEFNEANIPFNGNEIVSIVQGNQNKRVLLKDLVSQIFNLGVSDFVNITDKYDAPNISLEEAIRLIPSRARKEGQVITFLDREDHWHIYQFKGVLNQWNVLDQWEDLFDWEKLIINSILPDEEDLTKSLPDNNGNSYLSLKDREYNPEDFSGLGRVILRKNIVEVEDPIYGKVKKNILYQDMINKSNTIYEIRYDFDLNGEEITIPEGCILKFEGGILKNGNIIGNNTTINADLCQIFDNSISINGKWNAINIYPEWFGAESFYDIRLRDTLEKFQHYNSPVHISNGGTIGGKLLFGTRDNACMLNINPSVNGADILGIENIESRAKYSGRDLVGLYVRMQANKESGVIVQGSNFTENSVVLSELPKCLVKGVILDVVNDEKSESNKFSGIVTDIIQDTRTVYVDFWAQIGNTSKGQIPNFNNVIVNPCTKIWGENINTFLTPSTTPTSSVIGEYGIFNTRTKNNLPGIGNGFDTVLFSGKGGYGYCAEVHQDNKDTKFENGFLSLENNIGFKSYRDKVGLYIENIPSNKSIQVCDNSKLNRFEIDGSGFVTQLTGKRKTLTPTDNVISEGYKAIIIPSNVNEIVLDSPSIEGDVYCLYRIGNSPITIRSTHYINTKAINGKEISQKTVTVSLGFSPAILKFLGGIWYLFYNSQYIAVPVGSEQKRPVDLDYTYFSGYLYFNYTTKKLNVFFNNAWFDIDGAISDAARSGTFASKPTTLNLYEGFKYFTINSNNHCKPIYAHLSDSGVSWFESDGAVAGVARSGTFANRPASNDIYIGFLYMRTDGDSNTKYPIYYGGDDKWYKADGTEIVN